VVHGRHIAFLDDAVLFREVGFGEGLSVAVSDLHVQLAILSASKRTQRAYGLVGGVADLLAHELIHPVVGLLILAAVGREAGDDERHVGGCCWRVFGFVQWAFRGMSWFSRIW
jgi:hypothetical protein